MNERKMIAVALVVIAATMVVNLFARTERIAEAQTTIGPAEPALVAAMVKGSQFNHDRLYRVWSDGAVDLMIVDDAACASAMNCGEIIQILPGSCAADITRNGAVDFPDLLGVLSDWGPCPKAP